MADTPRLCRQCENLIDADARACPYCGARVFTGDSQPAGLVEPDAGPAAVTKPVPVAPPRRGRGVSMNEAVGVILGAALLFLTIASMGVITLPKLGFNLRLPGSPAGQPATLPVLAATLPALTTAPPFNPTPTPLPLPTYPPATSTVPLEATPPVSPTLPAPTPLPPVPGPEEISYQGVRFSYDPALLDGYNAQTLPETAPSADIPAWSVAPQHIQITFTGYPLSGAFHTPALYVYPAKDFAAISPAAAVAVDALTALLRDRPAQVETDLPFLPVWNAAQVFHAQVEYLPFAGGSGVRYLTQYGQGLAPLNNHALFYTFQGLTADGRFYVVAVFPVNHPELPAGADAETYAAIADRYSQYLSESITWLDTQPDDGFTPSLALLDQLVRSLELR